MAKGRARTKTSKPSTPPKGTEDDITPSRQHRKKKFRFGSPLLSPFRRSDRNTSTSTFSPSKSSGRVLFGGETIAEEQPQPEARKVGVSTRSETQAAVPNKREANKYKVGDKVWTKLQNFRGSKKASWKQGEIVNDDNDLLRIRVTIPAPGEVGPSDSATPATVASTPMGMESPASAAEAYNVDVARGQGKNESSGRLRRVDLVREALPTDKDKRFYDVLKHSRNQLKQGERADAKAADLKGLDHILIHGSPVLDGMNVQDQLQMAMKNQDVIDIAMRATGKPPTAKTAFMILSGLQSGVELQDLRASDSTETKVNATFVMEGIKHHTASEVEKFDALEAELTKCFFLAVACARTKKTSEYDPTTGLYDKEGRRVLSDPGKLEKRAAKLNAAIAALHSAQYSKIQTEGPASAALFYTLLMILDMKSASDEVVNRFAALGIGANAQYLRSILARVAAEVDPYALRSPDEYGRLPIILNTADNADFSLFSRVVSVIAMGSLLLCFQSPEDVDHLHSNYCSGLPDLTEDLVEDLEPTEGMDADATRTLDRQSILALVVGYCCFRDPSLSFENPGEEIGLERLFAPGDEIEFVYRGAKRIGKVKAVYRDDTIQAEYREADFDMTVTSKLPRDKVRHRVQTQAATSTSTNSASPSDEMEGATSPADCADAYKQEFKRFLGNYIAGVHDGGGRDKKTTVASGIVTDLVTGVSSKSNLEASHAIFDRLVALRGGKKKFEEQVHVFMSDQEFMPTFFKKVFLSIASESEDTIPLILILSTGHCMKSIAVSLLQYFSSFYDPILEAQGAPPGSTEYKRIRKGRVIRETVRRVITGTEAFRVSAVIRYLHEMSKVKGILNPYNNKLMSPMGILNVHFKLLGGAGPAASEESPALLRFFALSEELAIDAHGRVSTLRVSEALYALASHFRGWATESFNNCSDVIYMGPSGYYRCDERFEAAFRATDEDEGAHREDYGDYEWVKEMEYNDLREKCKAAGIDKNLASRKSKVLQHRYYIYRKTLQERFSEEIAAAEACKHNPAPRRPLPEGCSLSSAAAHRLLFGVDVYCMIKGSLVSRVAATKREDSSWRCRTCSKGRRNCRCASSCDLTSFFLSCCISVLQRQQPHYSRLLLYQLIYQALILKHADTKVKELVIERMEAAMAMHKFGDRHNGQSGDLIQEEEIVAPTKRYAASSTSSSSSMHSRVLFGTIVQRIRTENAARNHVLGPMPPHQPGRRNREARQLRRAFSVGTALMNRLIEERETAGDVEDRPDNDIIVWSAGELRFNDPQRYFWAPVDANIYMKKFLLTLVKGLKEGIDAAAPYRPNKPLSSLHKRAKKRGRLNGTAIAAQRARTLASEQQKLADQAGFVQVGQNDGMLSLSADKAPNNACLLFSIIETLLVKGGNQPYAAERGQIGHGPHPPILLSKSLESSRSEIVARLPEDAPIIVVVDLTLSLTCLPPRRDRGQWPLSYQEVARDVLVDVVTKHYSPRVSLILMVMDVYGSSSSLAKAAWSVRRGGAQLIADDYYGAASKTRKPTDMLKGEGINFAGSIKHDKGTFVPFMFNTMANEMKAADSNEWKPSELFPDGSACSLGLIGGSPDVCTFVGPSDIKISSHGYLSRQNIAIGMRPVIKAGRGDGGSVSFACVRHLVSMGFDAQNEVDCTIVMHCRDLNKAVAMSSGLIQSFKNAARNGRGNFAGSILLAGRNKTIDQIMKLPNRYRQALGITSGSIPATGDGFVLRVSPISLHYVFEQDERLAHLPRGHSFIAVAMGALAVVQNSMLQMNGFSVQNYVKALLSKEHQAISRSNAYDEASCSPVAFGPTSFDLFLPAVEGDRPTLCFSGITLVFAIMMAERSQTRKVFGSRYSKEKLKDIPSLETESSPYELLRACSLLGGETVQPPDPVSLMSYLSVSNAILDFCTAPLSAQGDEAAGRRLDDICHTTLSDEKNGLNIDFTLYGTYRRNKKLSESRDNEIMETLYNGQFGALFHPSQFRGKRPWCFKPIQEAKKALRNRGIYETVHVNAGELIHKHTAQNSKQLNEFLERLLPYLDKESEYDREHGGDNLRWVFESTCYDMLKDKLQRFQVQARRKATYVSLSTCCKYWRLL